ncbi:hypothetical protein [Cognatilysobacter terrigena]|uniref:hypothetical protein n=1 Tax=Cognatilysobacter terrigena TaxID=2488749 RepID=UPI00105CBDE1|nr:hypothetical protein [Lysobacter terrigena]
MRFDLYGRADGRCVLVPTVLPHPIALAREGPLYAIGSVVLSFAALSPELSYSIALTGFGIAGDDDDALIDIAIRNEAVAALIVANAASEADRPRLQ